MVYCAAWPLRLGIIHTWYTVQHGHSTPSWDYTHMVYCAAWPLRLGIIHTWYTVQHGHCAAWPLRLGIIHTWYTVQHGHSVLGLYTHGILCSMATPSWDYTHMVYCAAWPLRFGIRLCQKGVYTRFRNLQIWREISGFSPKIFKILLEISRLPRHKETGQATGYNSSGKNAWKI